MAAVTGITVSNTRVFHTCGSVMQSSFRCACDTE